MRKWKSWLIEKFLPAWCRAELIEENRRLELKIQKQSDEIVRLNSYIDGMHDALRYRQRIAINGKGGSI